MGSNGYQGGRSAYLVEHPVQLIACLTNTVAVVAVNHENETLSVLEVMPPQRADLQGRPRLIQVQAELKQNTATGSPDRQSTHLVLTTHIPHGEAYVLVLHRLHIESCIPAAFSHVL